MGILTWTGPFFDFIIHTIDLRPGDTLDETMKTKFEIDQA
jgi:hypothetical protein